jgi:hypothetical protein
MAARWVDVWKFLMTKRKNRNKFNRQQSTTNAHFENLLDVREINPKAFARLGDGPNMAVENYEVEQLASEFEKREGIERLLDLRERLPNVFAQFTDETKRTVARYAERKHAFDTINDSARNST